MHDLRVYHIAIPVIKYNKNDFLDYMYAKSGLDIHLDCNGPAAARTHTGTYNSTLVKVILAKVGDNF